MTGITPPQLAAAIDATNGSAHTVPVPDSSQTPTTPITFGPCPKCQTPMRLGLIEPDRPNHEQRTYRCDSCGHSETKTVKYR
jgi:hypothetical protein